LTPVTGSRGLGEETPPLEGAQHSTQVTGVDSESLDDYRGSSALSVVQLEEHPHFGEGERRIEKITVESADQSRVKAIESPHRLDLVAGAFADLGSDRPRRGHIAVSAKWLTLSSNLGPKQAR